MFNDDDSEGENAVELSDDAEDAEDEEALRSLRRKEKIIEQNLNNLNEIWERRKNLLKAEIERVDAEIIEDQAILEASMEEDLVEEVEEAPLQPGYEHLSWLDDSLFTNFSALVIFANMVTIALEAFDTEHVTELWLAEQLFLLFYVVELTLRFQLHRWSLFFQSLSKAWCYWLDLFVVVAGVVEQWVYPLLSMLNPDGSGDTQTSFHSTVLRMLRLLRLARLVRFVKVFKLLWETDFSWATGGEFQTFITCIIALNAIILGIELDHPWGGWIWVEESLLVIYCFELFVRFKHLGLSFFYDADAAWNNLDFVIVMGGVIEQWVLPVYSVIVALVNGRPVEVHLGHGLLPLLRMLRLLRVLRLLRLFKTFTPLYKLGLGIIETWQTVQWVMILIALVLYISGVIFTSVVGHRLGGDVPEEASSLYDSIFNSMFFLFKVMNGDLAPMEPLLHTNHLRILFIFYMILSNWMVLAVLTAVVSDGMLTATNQHQKEEEKSHKSRSMAEAHQRVIVLFEEMDKDHDGFVTEAEFYALLKEEGLRKELLTATGFSLQDLTDMFMSFCAERDDDSVQYRVFIEKLKQESQDATGCAVFRLERKVNAMEKRIMTRLDAISSGIQEVKRRFVKYKQAFPDRETELSH